MACGKCERLIKEGLLEGVEEVADVRVFREEGYANIIIKQQPDSLNSFEIDIKSRVLDIIHSLVNGKFKAVFAAGK